MWAGASSARSLKCDGHLLSELKEARMSIVGGLDLHRGQITYDCADTSTGEVMTGRIVPATREALAEFLAEFDSADAEFVVEGCTGWWFVTDEVARAGMTAHVADPAEAAALRGKKQRAKTDRADARHLRCLLADGRVPESWIPPPHMIEIRALGRGYHDLIQVRNSWVQRIHATMLHHGAPALTAELAKAEGTERAVETAGRLLPSQVAHTVRVAVRQIEALNSEIDPIRRRLQWVGRHQPAARRISDEIWGIGLLTGPIIWVEMGDVRRFSSSDQAVRHTGLDVTVRDSDGKRSPGHLSRQGPGILRWALYEAATTATRPSSPDHRYYRQVKARKGHTVAVISVARKHARRVYHLLRQLGDQALQPPPDRPPPPPLR